MPDLRERWRTSFVELTTTESGWKIICQQGTLAGSDSASTDSSHYTTR